MLKALREQNRIIKAVARNRPSRYIGLDEAIETIKKHPLLNREIYSGLQEVKDELQAIAQHWAYEVRDNREIDETDLSIAKKKLDKAASALSV